MWTVDIPVTGTYMCVFHATSLTTSNGARGVNIWIDGVKTDLQSYLYFNEPNAHRAMNTDIEFLALTAGPHTFWSKDNGSCLGDYNDRSSLMLIPCDPA